MILDEITLITEVLGQSDWVPASGELWARGELTPGVGWMNFLGWPGPTLVGKRVHLQAGIEGGGGRSSGLNMSGNCRRDV